MVSRRPRRRRGFSLVEILVTLGVSLLALLGTLAAMRVLLGGTGAARDLTEASLLVQARLEELATLPGVTLTAPPQGATTEPDLDALGQRRSGGAYTRTTTWGLTADGRRRLITVTVDWLGPDGRAHRVTGQRERAP